MTLIITKLKDVLDMPSLYRAVLKFIFDEKNMSSSEIVMMKHSVIDWASHLRIKKECNEMSAVDKQNQYSLESMAKMLQDNELGLMDHKKAVYKEHKIDYRKAFRLPEAYVPEDFIKAQKAIERAKTKRPEENE